MNEGSTKRGTNTATALALLLLRHGVASLATIVAACAIWTVTYFALLLWAIAHNGGLGGPLAYPVGLLFATLTASLASLVLFFPSTALAEWACHRRNLPMLAQVPLTVALLAVLSVLAGSAIQALHGQPVPSASLVSVCAWLFGLSLIPIGFYWWIAQAGPLLRATLGLLPRTFASIHHYLACGSKPVSLDR